MSLLLDYLGLFIPIMEGMYTETMCGAVAQLLRKGLNQSDQRYWSLCLPFVLNALNSTVHTATGYTTNSLFFGRYQERDLVPLIPNSERQ
jgi:hypothetical protein